jgi:hypothetical protein
MASRQAQAKSALAVSDGSVKLVPRPAAAKCYGASRQEVYRRPTGGKELAAEQIGMREIELEARLWARTLPLFSILLVVCCFSVIFVPPDGERNKKVDCRAKFPLSAAGE